MGKRKRNAKKMRNGSGLAVPQCKEEAASQASVMVLADPPSAPAPGDGGGSPVKKSEAANASQVEMAVGEQRSEDGKQQYLERLRARIALLDRLHEEHEERQREQQREQQAERERWWRALEQARALRERERQRHENTERLAAAETLHGRGVIDQLEERWMGLSQHPHIAQLGQWGRWAILKEEHADELRGVMMDGQQLITEDVWDNLLAVMQQLHHECGRSVQGWNWMDDRVWIEADDLGPCGGRVLMALCKCLNVCFTCFDQGAMRTSKETLNTGYDEFDLQSTYKYAALFDV